MKKVETGGRCSKPPIENEVSAECFWNGVAREAFPPLNNAIRTDPMLALLEEGGEYVLHSDISEYAVGAVLSQMRQDGVTRVIAYWSRKLKSEETPYLTYDIELLAMQDIVVHWH